MRQTHISYLSRFVSPPPTPLPHMSLGFTILGDDDPSVNLVQTEESAESQARLDGSGAKPGGGEDLLEQILNEVDDFFEAEDRPSKKRSRLSLADEERLGGMQQLRLKLKQANDRAEAALKRVEKTEERNMELIAEAKEREAEWLEEKKSLEEEVMTLRMSSKSNVIQNAEKLRDALRSIREMRSAQQTWKVKEAQLVASEAAAKKQFDQMDGHLKASQKMLEQSKQEVIMLMERKIVDNENFRPKSSPARSSVGDLTRIAQLERSERKLQRRVKGMTERLPEQEILNEKCNDLARKLKRAQDELQEAHKRSARTEYVQSLQDDWDAMFNTIVADEADEGEGSTRDKKEEATPTKTLLLLRKIQNERNLAVNSKKLLQERLEELDLKCSNLKEELASLKKLAGKGSDKLAKVEEKFRRMQSQCVYLQKQNLSLKNVIQSYEDEYGQDTDVKKDEGNDSETPKKKRHGLLQEALSASNAQLQSVMKEMSASPSPAAHSGTLRRMAKMEIALREREEENAKLKKERLRLDELVGRLESKVGRGEFNAKTTKVLHLSMNPDQMRRKAQAEERKTLKEEVARLRDIIQTNGIDETSSESRDQSSKASIVTSAEVANLKKKNIRLKEVFRNLTTNFKTAVYQLTGWKIDMDMRNDKPIVLRSIFAANESDKLEFNMAEGDVQLLETPFAKQLDEKTFFYLTTCRSPPAFLSQVTMQLFEQTTMTGTGTI